MTKAQRLEKLLALLRHHEIEWPLPVAQTRIDRIYAGHHQRSAGAWSWRLWFVTDVTKPTPQFPSVGSQWTVAEILKAGPAGTVKYISPIGHYEIIVTVPCRERP